MKKVSLLIAFFCFLYANAQDVIVKKDGSTILSKVLEVNTSDIKYKKYSNPNGPTYTISKSEIMSINYENGEKESYEDIKAVQNEPLHQYVEKAPDARNSELIALYNRIYEPTDKIKKKSKEANCCLVFVGVKKSSVMSNDEVEMTFEAKQRETPYGVNYWAYTINIFNKTNKNLYIDKSNCIRTSNDSRDYTFYNEKSQSSRFVIIPPKSSMPLVEETWDENCWIEGFERFRFKDSNPSIVDLNVRGLVQRGHSIVFEENDIPWYRKYSVTYSFDNNYKSFSCLYVEFYIKETIGCGSLMSPMNYRPHLGGLFEGELKFDKLIDGFNKYTIVGYRKIESNTTEYHPSTYVAESISKKQQQRHEQAVGAFVGSALSVVKAFANPQQTGTPLQNVNTGGNVTTNSGDANYNTNSYGITSNSYSSGSTSTSSSSSTSQHDLCNGTGKCNTCNGTGQMWKGFGLTGKTKCPNCNESGRCSGCNGTGRR